MFRLFIKAQDIAKLLLIETLNTIVKCTVNFKKIL